MTTWNKVHHECGPTLGNDVRNKRGFRAPKRQDGGVSYTRLNADETKSLKPSSTPPGEANYLNAGVSGLKYYCYAGFWGLRQLRAMAGTASTQANSRVLNILYVIPTSQRLEECGPWLMLGELVAQGCLLYHTGCSPLSLASVARAVDWIPYNGEALAQDSRPSTLTLRHCTHK